MPIRIRELHIKATVSDERPIETPTVSTPDVDMQTMIAACVEQVLKRLKAKAER